MGPESFYLEYALCAITDGLKIVSYNHYEDTLKFIQGVQYVQVIRHTNQSGAVLCEIAKGRKILPLFVFFFLAFYTNYISIYNYKDSGISFQNHL